MKTSRKIKIITMNQKEFPELKKLNDQHEKCKESFNIRMDQEEERLCKLEDRKFDIIESSEYKRKRMKKSGKCLHELWDTNKRTKMQVTGVPERKQREKQQESLFKEIMSEYSPNLHMNLDIQVHEVRKSPKKEKNL